MSRYRAPTHQAIIVAAGAFMAMAPVGIAFGRDNCGWCGADAQALGRALNMGGPAPCYCPPPPPPKPPQKKERPSNTDRDKMMD